MLLSAKLGFEITAAICGLHDFFGNLGIITMIGGAIAGILAFIGVPPSTAAKIGIGTFKLFTNCAALCFIGNLAVDWANK